MWRRFLSLATVFSVSLLVHADSPDSPVGGPAPFYQYSVVLELDEPAGGWSSDATRIRLRAVELLAALGHGEVGGEKPQPFEPLEPGFGNDIYPDWDTMEVVDLDSGMALTCLDGAGDRQCNSTALQRGPNLFAGSGSFKMKQELGHTFALADWPLGTTEAGDPRSLRDVASCPGPTGPSPLMIDRSLDCSDLPVGIDGAAPRLAYRDAGGSWLDPSPKYTYGLPVELLSPELVVATPGAPLGAPDPILTIDHNLGQWETGSPGCFLTYEIDPYEGATYSVSYKDKTATVGPCGDSTSATKIRDDLVATINATFPASEPIDQPFAIPNGEASFDFVLKGAEGFSPNHEVSAGIVEEDRSYCMEQTDICVNSAVQPLTLMPQLGDAHPSYYTDSNSPIASPEENRNIPYLIQFESAVDFAPGMDAGARWIFRTFAYSDFADECGSSFSQTSYIGKGPAGPGGVDRYQHGFVVGDPHCFRKMDMLGLAWGAGQTRLGNLDLVRLEPWLVVPPSQSTASRRLRISWNPANARNEFASLPVVDDSLSIVETNRTSFDASGTQWLSPHSYALEMPPESPLSMAVINARSQLGREAVFPEALRPRARVSVARNEAEALQLYVRTRDGQSLVVTGAIMAGGQNDSGLSATGVSAGSAGSYFSTYSNLVNARGEPFVGRIVPYFLVRTEAYLSEEASGFYGSLKNAGKFDDRSSAYLPFEGGNTLLVPGGEVGGVRLLVKPSLDVSPSIEGGVYSGTLEINLEGEALPVEVPIEIEVYELVLPLKPALDRLTGNYRRQALDPAMWHGVNVGETVPKNFSDFLLDSLADYRISGFLEGAGSWYEGPSDNYPYRPLPTTLVHDGESRFAITQKFTPSLNNLDTKQWHHEIETHLVPHAGPAQAMDAHGLWQTPSDSSSGRFYTYSSWHNWNALGPAFGPAGSPTHSISGRKRCLTDGYCNDVDGSFCAGADQDAQPEVWGQCTPIWYPVYASMDERPWWETVHSAFHQQLAADLRSRGSRDVFSAPQEAYWYIDELRYVGSACAGETMEAYADGYVDAYTLAAPFGWKPQLTLDYSGQYELWRERAIRAEDPEALPAGFEVRFAGILWAVKNDLNACEDEDPATPCPYASYDPASPPSVMISRGNDAGMGFYAHHHRITGTSYGAGGSWLGEYMAPSCVEVKAGTETPVPVICGAYSAGDELANSDFGGLAPKHRFEHLRDASDDYDYLALLKTRQALAAAGNLALESMGAIDSIFVVGGLGAGDWSFARPVFVATGVTATVTLEVSAGTASLHVRANGVPSSESTDPDQCDETTSATGVFATCPVVGPAYAYVAVEAAADDGAVEAVVSILAEAPASASPDAAYADVVQRNLAHVAALSSGEDDPFNWLEVSKRLTTDMDALMSLRNEIAHSFSVFVPAAGGSGGGFQSGCIDSSDCDDHNDCTQDTCAPDGPGSSNQHCQHAPMDGTSCSDGNACTTNGLCQAGVCVSEVAVPDSNYCTFNGLFDGSSCEALTQPMNGVACSVSEANPSQNPTGVCVDGACLSCGPNLSGESCSECSSVYFPGSWVCECTAEGGCQEQPSGYSIPIDVCADSDGDGLGDAEEIENGTHPHLADTDDDGLDDGVETGTGVYVDAEDTGSDPLNDDTDGDGLGDGEEVEAGRDPNVVEATAVPALWPLGTVFLVALMSFVGIQGILWRSR